MKNKSIQIAPSVLSADFSSLKQEIIAVQNAGADLIHCDIMDGCFVPNITFGPFIVEAIKHVASVPLDVHLMITHPERFIRSFADAGADIITVHAEACEHLDESIGLIRECKKRVGVSVNPDKEVALFLPYFTSIDQVLIMSVFAGFSGQKFIPEVLLKIKHIYDYSGKSGHFPDIEVDGGINHETALLCAQEGANIFVAGSYIFHGTDYKIPIEKLRQSARKGCCGLLDRNLK